MQCDFVKLFYNLNAFCFIVNVNVVCGEVAQFLNCLLSLTHWSNYTCTVRRGPKPLPNYNILAEYGVLHVMPLT